MAEATPRGIPHPVAGDLIKSAATVAQLATDLTALATTVDIVIGVEGHRAETAAKAAAADVATQAALISERTEAVRTELLGVTGTQQTTLDSHGVRISGLEELSSLAPGEITDGSVSVLVQEPSSLTRLSLDEVYPVRQEVLPRQEFPSAAARALDTYALSSPAEDGLDFRAPRVVNETELVRDPDDRLVDGAKFFAPVHVGALPGTWADEWYGYVAGHDSPSIYLMTAPDLLGPWTWQQEVVGIVGSGALMEDATFQAHTSSPEVIVKDGLIHLYYHGPLASNLLEQPTALATSMDGVNFTDQGIVISTEYTNNGSPYRTSTSYARIAKHAGLYHAIWQGTTGRASVVDGYTYTPMPAGRAVSVDGRAWTKLEPILPSESKDQGMFAPGLVRIAGGWLVAGAYRTYNGTGQTESVKVYFGETLDALRPVGSIILPGAGRVQSLTSPAFVAHNNKLYMIGGSRLAGETEPIISALEIDWS